MICAYWCHLTIICQADDDRRGRLCPSYHVLPLVHLLSTHEIDSFTPYCVREEDYAANTLFCLQGFCWKDAPLVPRVPQQRKECQPAVSKIFPQHNSDLFFRFAISYHFHFSLIWSQLTAICPKWKVEQNFVWMVPKVTKTYLVWNIKSRKLCYTFFWS